MQNKTVSAILIWVAIAMLLLDGFFKSQWIYAIGIALVVIAVTVYLYDRLAKRDTHQTETTNVQRKE